MALVPHIKNGDWNSVRQAVAKLASLKLGPTSEPTFAGVTFTGLTASRLIQTDSDKKLASVSDLTSWIAGTSNQIIVADDSDGTVTLSTPQDIHTGASPTFAGLTVTNRLLFDTTNNNTHLGYLAGTTLSGATYPEKNVFVGEEAGQNLKWTTGSEGKWNVYVGYAAGKGGAATTGYGNVGVGKDALETITTGLFNTVVGFQAAQTHQSGTGNTAIGVNAFLSNVSGSYNTALGMEALRDSLGSYNVGLGFRASGDNDGSYNVFLGHAAGHNQVTVDNMLFIHNVLENNAADELTNSLIVGYFPAHANGPAIVINGTLTAGKGTFLSTDVLLELQYNANNYVQFLVNSTGTAMSLQYSGDTVSFDIFNISNTGVSFVIDINDDLEIMTDGGNIDFGSNTLTTTGLSRLDGGLGIGINPTSTIPLYVLKSQNSGAIINLTNSNAGSASWTAIETLSDSAKIGMRAHATGRTATRLGSVVLGGNAELLAQNSGLIICTLDATKSMWFGTENIRAIKIDGTNQDVLIGLDDTNHTLIDAAGNIKPKGTGFLIIQKASGNGIKVDQTTPTFGFADLLGDQFSKNTGGTKPTLVAYNGAVDAWQFSNGDEAFLSYHIPHDYVAGTDIHLHVHWSQNATGATGGTVDFKYFAVYSKGHNQASGSTFTSTPITDTFSSIDINDGGSGLNQYQQHFTEVTISAGTATAALFDRDDFEPDGVIELTLEMDADNLTGTPSSPFIHYVDIHYQTTSIIGTKSRTPDFYV